jgi:non-ribosomal peptide synthetase component F
MQSVLTSISEPENNVSERGSMATLMHRGFERAADRFGDRDAVRVGDERWSFRDHDGLANAFARHLGAHGVGFGDRVAVMTSNRVEVVAAVHAVSKFGAAAVLLSPAWKAVEVDHALGLARPRHAVADGPTAALLTELLNLLAAAEAGATVRLHRRFELDEVLRRIATERMTLEMAVAPIALALARRRSVRLAPPRVAPRQRPRPAGRVDLGRLLGRAGGLAPGALRRRLLRPVVAHGTSAGGRRRRR